MTGGPKITADPSWKPGREIVEQRFLDSFIFEDDAWVPLWLVRKLWVMDHMDTAHALPGKDHTKGAKMLKDRGARMGSVKGVGSVLRGVRLVDERDELSAIHALVTGGLVPLLESVRAWREAGDILLPQNAMSE